MTTQTETSQRPVLVVDFGAQYAQLIARRVREAGVYSELVPHTATAEEIAAKEPVGIILSGGPSSVYEPGAPAIDPGVFDLGVPTLGICYGFQVMAQTLGWSERQRVQQLQRCCASLARFHGLHGLYPTVMQQEAQHVSEQ